MKKITIVKCPICKGDVLWDQNPYRPFCTERCKNLDLSKWADESYKISNAEKGTAFQEPEDE